jgi:hypothetical protein
VHGVPSPLVEASYLAALELVERLDDAERRFLVLWGLWFVHFTRGDYPTAVHAGERLLETAKNGDDTGQLLEAHHTLWPPLVAMDELKRARLIWSEASLSTIGSATRRTPLCMAATTPEHAVGIT